MVDARRDRDDDDEDRTSQRRARARRDDDDDSDERPKSRRRRDEDDDDDDRQEAHQKRRGSNSSRSPKDDDDERDRDDDRRSRRSDTRMAGPQQPIAIAGWIWLICAGLILINGSMAYVESIHSRPFWNSRVLRAIVLAFSLTGFLSLWFGVRGIIGLVRAVQTAGIGSIVLAVYHLVVGLVAIAQKANFFGAIAIIVAIGLGGAAYLALANAFTYADWRDRREEEFYEQEDERWRRWKRRRARDDDDDYHDSDVPRVFPEYPGPLALANWLWILSGMTWIYIGLAISVLTVRLGMVLNKEMNPLLYPIAAIIIVIGSYFAYAGLRIRNGRATSTLPHGIGSVVFFLFGAFLSIAEVQDESKVGAVSTLVPTAGILVAGILALVYNRSYEVWQKDISRA